jgi:hypothetical protein
MVQMDIRVYENALRHVHASNVLKGADIVRNHIYLKASPIRRHKAIPADRTARN